MKRLFLALFIIGSVISSCTGNNAPKQESSVEEPKKEVISNDKVYNLDDLLLIADKMVGKTVKVKGYVTHTCKHSGKRCFLAGENQKNTIRVEAKGNIGGFNRELIGSQIEVTGVLKENRLETAKIDEMEKAIAEKRIKDDGSIESCNAETANIQKMRQWMKDNGKNYYSIYYIDGQDYNEIN